jgi:two-component system chemotaxis response regulator CheB
LIQESPRFQAGECQNLQSAAAKYEDHAKSLDAEVSLIRDIIINGLATKQNIVETDEEQPQ